MSQAVDELVEIMRRLRDPDRGCPWDIKQDFKSLTPCTLEEAYEVVEAIEEGDPAHMCEELGDLLMQVVFYAQMAAEEGLFTIDDVARGETQKMIERHPHVFGDRAGVKTAGDVLKNWEADKHKKRAQAASEASKPHSLLDGVGLALPALVRAEKLQKRAARVGFDWDAPLRVLEKVREEADELEAEIAAAAPKDKVADELGDLLFALVNLARKLEVDPEEALRRANRKFDRRFRHIEASLAARQQEFSHTTLEEMETLWDEAKRREMD